MIKNLITLLIVGLVLYLIYVVVGLLVQGTILLIVGIILALIFVWKAFEILGINLP